MPFPKRITYHEAVLQAIDEILLGGTRVVSFRHGSTYHHNILIGAHKANPNKSHPFVAKVSNRAVYVDDGGTICLRGICNNESHRIGDFTLGLIENFSFLEPRHFFEAKKPTLWKKFCRLICRLTLSHDKRKVVLY